MRTRTTASPKYPFPTTFIVAGYAKARMHRRELVLVHSAFIVSYTKESHKSRTPFSNGRRSETVKIVRILSCCILWLLSSLPSFPLLHIPPECNWEGRFSNVRLVFLVSEIGERRKAMVFALSQCKVQANSRSIKHSGFGWFLTLNQSIGIASLQRAEI